MNNNKLKEALELLGSGLRRVMMSLSYCTEDSEMLCDVLSGDDFTLDCFRKCATYSIDEEYYEVTEYLEEFAESNGFKVRYDRELYDNHVKELYDGLRMAVEATDIIVELTRDNKELRDILREDITIVDYDGEGNSKVAYNPFKQFGIVGYNTGLKGFRRAYLAVIKQRMGRYAFEKAVA